MSDMESKGKKSISDLFERYGKEAVLSAYSSLIQNKESSPYLLNLSSVEEINNDSGNIVDIAHYNEQLDKFQTEYILTYIVPKLDKTGLIHMIKSCMNLYGCHEVLWVELASDLEKGCLHHIKYP